MEIEVKENIITDGLVLHLDSWNSSSYSGSGSTWTDLSGNGNNASLVGGYSYNDKSLSYGDSGYANITDTSDFDFSGDFSLESWFYLTETPDSTFPSAIFASWASAFTSNDKIILFINSSGQIAFQINTGTNTLIYPSTVSLNQWYHIVVSRVNGVIDIYLNGQRGTSLNYSLAVTPVLDMRIGAYAYKSDPLGQSFVGKIPVARIYKDKGLTEKEVRQNYINQKGRFFVQNNLTIEIEDAMPTDGLILRLDAANKNSYPGSGTTWYDLSGNGYDATLVNGPTYSNDNGGSITFDGNDDYATTPITTTYQNFTLNCFFYNTSSSKIYRNLISKISYYATELTDFPVSLSLNDSGTEITIQIASGTSYSITDASTGSRLSASLDSLNTWYYVSATYDKQNLKLYLNGQLVASTPNTISLPNNTLRSWAIGRASFEVSGGVGESQYNGNISQVSIYNRALTSEEIENIYNQRYSSGNNLAISSDGFPTSLLSDAGMIFSSISWSSPTTNTSYLNPNETSSEFYADNYSKIVPYQETDLLYAYTVGTLNGTNRHNTGDRAITTPGPHIFPYFDLNWTLELVARNGCWDYDKCNASVEFLNEFDICVFAIRTLSGSYQSYFHRLQYGANLNSLTLTGTSGQYPQTQGNLTFTPTSARFTNTRTTNYNSNFTFNCDMLSVRKIRISNVTTEASYNLTVPSSPNPCSAYVYLKIV